MRRSGSCPPGNTAANTTRAQSRQKLCKRLGDSFWEIASFALPICNAKEQRIYVLVSVRELAAFALWRSDQVATNARRRRSLKLRENKAKDNKTAQRPFLDIAGRRTYAKLLARFNQCFRP